MCLGKLIFKRFFYKMIRLLNPSLVVNGKCSHLYTRRILIYLWGLFKIYIRLETTILPSRGDLEEIHQTSRTIIPLNFVSFCVCEWKKLWTTLDHTAVSLESVCWKFLVQVRRSLGTVQMVWPQRNCQNCGLSGDLLKVLAFLTPYKQDHIQVL